MGFVTKTVVRVAVIGAVAGGVAVVAAQTPKGRAIMHQVHSSVSDRIDSVIDDPIVLRNQLRELQAQYPDRIAEVRADLQELRSQTGDLERELAISERVVELAANDLGELSELIARGEEARTQNTGFRVVRLRYDDQSMSLQQAYAKVRSITQFQQSHDARRGDITRDLDLLGQQEARLSELLTQLETEQAEFDTQLYQLDRQVDAIARNDRMIDLLEKRQKTIDKYDRYTANSLGEVQTKIARLLAEQEGRLTSLGNQTSQRSYEEQAEAELDLMLKTGRSFIEDVEIEKPQPEILEITPDEGERVLGRLN